MSDMTNHHWAGQNAADQEALEPAKPCQAQSLGRSKLMQFWSQEDGTQLIFGMIVFIIMLFVGGVAVDMMRYENERVRLQSASDRAALAAASVSAVSAQNTMSPEDIAMAWFAAEGLDRFVGGRIRVTDDPNDGREVVVAPAATVPSLFMTLLGIDDLPILAPARASEAAGGGSRDLEMVLVLDISGSMSGNRIVNLRNAARALAQDLLAGNTGRVAMTIVPYDGEVLPNAAFMSHFTNVVGNSSWACVDFPGNGNGGNNNNNWRNVTGGFNLPMVRRNCNTAAWAQIQIMATEAQAVAAINGLVARGTTSIDLGARWAAMFLNPAIRPGISAEIAAGRISSVHQGRPADWDDPNTLKVMLLMTDGVNCCGTRGTTQQMDTRTLDTCAGLRDNGVEVYAVAFEAPAGGRNLMMACASSAGHFFNTSGSGITDVFQSIGTHLQTHSLRLTQ